LDLAARPDQDQVMVHAAGYAPRGVTLGTPAPDGEADIGPAADGSYVVALVRGVSATGRVLQDGAPVAYAVLGIEADQRPPSPEQALDDDPDNDEDTTSDVDWPAGNSRKLVAGEDGRFCIGELSPGHWRLVISCDTAAARTVPFVVQAARDVDLGDVTLTG